jgi:pseudouridine-5'-phosphate glycosidase
MMETRLQIKPEVQSAHCPKSSGRCARIDGHRAWIARALRTWKRLPQSKDCARRGATPATIAVLNGELSAALVTDSGGLIADDADVKKLSTRDISIAVARRWNGANDCGRHNVDCASSGINSVCYRRHRRRSSRIITGRLGRSSGLGAYANDRSFASGAKIVSTCRQRVSGSRRKALPLSAMVVTRCRRFYSRSSGLLVDVRCDSHDEVAQIFKTQRELKIESALLITVPVPLEADVESSLLQRVLDDAIAKAERETYRRSAISLPFLLACMSERSEGATLRANVALLEKQRTRRGTDCDGVESMKTHNAISGDFDSYR